MLLQPRSLSTPCESPLTRGQTASRDVSVVEIGLSVGAHSVEQATPPSAATRSMVIPAEHDPPFGGTHFSGVLCRKYTILHSYLTFDVVSIMVIVMVLSVLSWYPSFVH